jgi:hypothetical protein
MLWQWYCETNQVEALERKEILVDAKKNAKVSFATFPYELMTRNVLLTPSICLRKMSDRDLDF